MEQLVKALFMDFAFETGILGSIKEFANYGSIFLVVLTWLSLFFGIKIYRTVFSILSFIATTLAVCLIMENYATWGAIVTTFSVIGVVTAFIGYKMKIIGASILSSVILVLAISLFYSNIMVLWIIFIVSCFAAFLYPAISISFTSALWGSLMILDMNIMNGAIFVVILGIVGFAFQLYIGKNKMNLGAENRTKLMNKLGIGKVKYD
ncbi:MAG: hypothetical protein LC122_02060 [Chitinophagales bacterium]|nr:hypothetical protein [Chitinophagales bacterium]